MRILGGVMPLLLLLLRRTGFDMPRPRAGSWCRWSRGAIAGFEVVVESSVGHGIRHRPSRSRAFEARAVGMTDCSRVAAGFPASQDSH